MTTYYGRLMQPSPAGRTIEAVAGNPDDIVARGDAITTLGGQMRSSAELLRAIESRASEQQGKAIDTLKERIGSSYETLFQAADLYEPVGPVIADYGHALAFVKPRIDAHAEECATLWSTFANLPGQIEPRGTGGFLEPEAGSPEAEEQAGEDEAKRAAYDAWVLEAEEFDADVDTWETAFDDAVDGFTDGVAGAIEDGGWRSFLDFAGQALGWAALVVGVAALIIGGPILGALALVIGVLSLAVTIAQALEGDKNGWDVALAVVGVLPVGKLGSLGKLLQGRGGAYVDDVLGAYQSLGKLRTAPLEMDGLLTAFRNGGSFEGFRQLLTGRSSVQIRDSIRGFRLGGDVGSVPWQALNAVDAGAAFAGQVLKFESWVARVTPYDGVGEVPILGDVLDVVI